MAKTVVMVTIEGLGTNLLGSYGGPWAQTPELDEFAANSLLLDQFWLDSPSPQRVLQAMWSGSHAAESKPLDGDSLPAVLARHNIDSWFISDSELAVRLATDAEFGQAIQLDIPTTLPEHWHECRIAQWMEMGLGAWASEDERPALLWLHGSGLSAQWDAPYAMRTALVDEEDPPPPTESAPPELFVAEDDVETAFGWSQAAAAQAMVLDHAWRWVDETLEALEITEDCLVVLMGTSGYSLGEHAYIGMAQKSLHAERLHAPCIMRPGRQLPLSVRSSDLTQPSDVWSTLLSWFEIDGTQINAASPNMNSPLPAGSRPLSHNWLALLDATSSFQRHAAYARCEEGDSIRVSFWGALWQTIDANESPSKASLFVHPEDRWQRNDVACRAVAMLEEVASYRDRWLDWLKAPFESPEPLPNDTLRHRP